MARYHIPNRIRISQQVQYFQAPADVSLLSNCSNNIEYANSEYSFHTVFRIRIRMDPHGHCLLDPYPDPAACELVPKIKICCRLMADKM
jgi:hypothetical protein